MNKAQFNILANSLDERGYKKYNQHWHHEDYVPCKVKILDGQFSHLQGRILID